LTKEKAGNLCVPGKLSDRAEKLSRGRMSRKGKTWRMKAEKFQEFRRLRPLKLKELLESHRGN